jgi:hypothetical protein
MGASAYVGRVGGLAVALGVGSAIVAGQGVAWAEGSEAAVSKPSTSASDGDATAAATSREKPQKKANPPKDDAESESTGSDDAGSTDAGAADTEDVAEDADDAEDETAQDDEADARPEATPESDPEPAIDRESPVTDDDSADKPSKTPTGKTSATVPEAAVADKATNSATNSADTRTDTSPAQNADDPGVPPTDPQEVAVLAVVTAKAKSTPIAPSPTVSSRLATPLDEPVAKKPTLITAVVNVVNSMLDWARQKADAVPGDAPQPPFLWALMAFARRELDTLFAARTTNGARSAVVTPTSLDLAEAATTAALVPSYSPWLNPQVSPSTNFVSWVTGTKAYLGNPLLANTYTRYGVYGTDVGVMWDNGMVDDPSTPDINEHQILIAVGDTFSNAAMTAGWRYNTLFRSSDTVLSDGLMILNGEWKNGNMFGGAPLGFAPPGYQDSKWARPIINRPTWAPNSVTLIPTAGISLPTAVTEATPFGTIQYVQFMSVSKWGQSGRWTTNYSATAYSTDNGENFVVAPQSVRYNSIFSGNRNFQQSAYVKGDDGYVYVYGTPNGRQGAAYLARVASEDILDVSKYEYYKKATKSWFWSTPAKWVKGSPSSASAIIGKSGGFFGFLKPGYTVSEMSVQYNEYLKKYIVLYGDQSNNIVMRTADSPEGTWSDATVLMTQQTGGIYAPMLHPWSPSTQGSGSDLYWNLSLWSDYNIMLMHTDLAKI